MRQEFDFTESERKKVLNAFFENNGRLKELPSKQKRKYIILNELIEKFIIGKIYTEREVNEVLKQVFNDFVTLRRYLIEFKFLARNKECSKYWVYQKSQT